MLTSMVSQYLAAPGGLHITTHYTAALLLHHHDHDRSPNRSPAVSESGLRALARKPCHLPELLQIRTHGPNASWGRSRSQSRQSNNPLKSLLPRPSHVREARKSRERAEREREWPWHAVALVLRCSGPGAMSAWSTRDYPDQACRRSARPRPCLPLSLCVASAALI